MKKITFTLLAALTLTGMAFGQATTTLQAPQYDGSNSSLSVPSSSNDANYHRSCWLILQSELTGLALTNSVITAMSLDYVIGAAAPTPGAYTICLANSNDATYTKGTSWASIIASMPQTNYVGPYTIPATNNFTSVVLPLTTSFTYTGGSVYITLEWFSATANGTQWARAQCNTTGLPTTGGVRGTAPVAGPAPTTLSTTAFRPCFSFMAANTASNEIMVSNLFNMGQISKLAQMGDVVSAIVTNKSASVIPTFSVGLAITGANNTANAQTVTNLAAGASSVVSFPAFVSTNSGLNNIAVAIPNDQNNSNNTVTGTQSVSCFVVGRTPATPSSSFTQLCYGGGGIVAFKYVTGTAPSSVVSVSGVAPSFANAGNSGNQLYAVLCDVSGNIVAQGNPVNLTATNMDVFTAFNFTAPAAMAANSTYYIGLASPSSTNYPFGTNTAADPVLGHYRIPISGGTPTQTDLEWLGLYGSLTFSATTVQITSNRTTVCKGEKTTLTAVGTPTTWQWSVANAGTASTIVVTPTVAGTAGTGIVSYGVGGTDPVTGCKGPNASIQVSVAACTGIMGQEAGAEIAIFPNPTASGKTNITGLSGKNTIAIYNAIGQQVMTLTATEETVSVDMSNLASGNYIVKITNSANESKIIKLVN
jgi:hypothetical protein